MKQLEGCPIWSSEFFVIRRCSTSRLDDLDGKSIIIQGLGNVGYHAANSTGTRWISHYRIIERDGAIINEAGLHGRSFLIQEGTRK